MVSVEKAWVREDLKYFSQLCEWEDTLNTIYTHYLFNDSLRVMTREVLRWVWREKERINGLYKDKDGKRVIPRYILGDTTKDRQARD